MGKKSCFFLGHADTPSTLYPDLLAAIERHIIPAQILSLRMALMNPSIRLIRPFIPDSPSPKQTEK